MYSSTSHDTFVICNGLWNVECGRGRGGDVWEGNTQSHMVNVACDVLLGIGLDLPHPQYESLVTPLSTDSTGSMPYQIEAQCNDARGCQRKNTYNGN